MNPRIVAQPDTAPPPAQRQSRGSYLRFVALLVLATLAFRSFVFTPFTIPSESMLPGLMKGDYLIAAKWPYGYSRWSLPLDVPLIDGTLFARLPERGDVAIFRHPVTRTEYIKRVIGLPGDVVSLRSGRVILNGREVGQSALPPFVIPVSPNTRCHPLATPITAHNGPACAYRAYREVLPRGHSYPVLDFGATTQDEFGPVMIPPGHVFMLGDNRDNSQDSRFAALAGGGIAMVPTGLLAARAEMVLFSTDGSADWYNPISWFTAARSHRIGDSL